MSKHHARLGSRVPPARILALIDEACERIGLAPSELFTRHPSGFFRRGRSITRMRDELIWTMRHSRPQPSFAEITMWLNHYCGAGFNFETNVAKMHARHEKIAAAGHENPGWNGRARPLVSPETRRATHGGVQHAGTGGRG